jgi:Holliday junction resolvasome RuvABC DNA-binding subunit
MDKLYDLNKKQQIDSLTSLGISKKQIKLLKLEEDRVNAILNPKSIKQIKVSKRDSLFGLNKKDQIQALEKLGLTKKEIRALRLESDRVEAIINKQKEEVK